MNELDKVLLEKLKNMINDSNGDVLLMQITGLYTATITNNVDNEYFINENTNDEKLKEFFDSNPITEVTIRNNENDITEISFNLNGFDETFVLVNKMRSNVVESMLENAMIGGK